MATPSTTTIPGTLFQAGFVAKGFIYAVIGVLAIQTATGRGGAATDSGGALEHIGSQPFGQILLWLLAIGVFGYAMWRFLEGFLDLDARGTDPKGAMHRVGSIFSGLVYTTLGITAIRLATATGGVRGDSKREATAWLLAEPAGVWILGLIGALVIGIGLYQVWRAIDSRIPKHLAGVQDDLRDTVRTVSRLGIAARGATLVLIGALVLQAAWTHDPSNAGGLDRALQVLASQPFGPWLLGLIAVGLLFYGIYCFGVAAYGRFPDVEISGDHVRQLPSETTAH